MVRLAFALTVLLTSCQHPTAQKYLKAKPAAVSPFLDQRWQMRPMRQRLPVHHVWVNTDPKVQNTVASRSELYIAPVEMGYLRPISKRLVKWEIEQGFVRPREADMARELRQRFIYAMSRSPRFRLVDHPTDRSLILAMAITELNPTSTKGNVVKFASKFLIGPLSGALGVFTKGNIAIEGKILVPGTTPMPSYLQFSDNEKDKMTFYNARDYQPYAHAKVAMNEWALQFEEFTRTMGHHTVKESSFITLKPW
jgi:hypothetical protein